MRGNPGANPEKALLSNTKHVPGPCIHEIFMILFSELRNIKFCITFPLLKPNAYSYIVTALDLRRVE